MDKEEFSNWIGSTNPTSVLTLSSKKLSVLFGKEFAALKGYSQNNPHHCYDLLEHTVITVSSLKLDGLKDRDQMQLKIAAWYHDIGKPNVAMEKNGRTVYYHHEIESERITRAILLNAGFEKDMIDKICFLIKYHGAFVSYKLGSEIDRYTNKYNKPITMESIQSKLQEIKTECIKEESLIPSLFDFKLLLRLCTADSVAQSSIVVQNGVEIDSRKKKLTRLEAIARIIDAVEERSS